MEKDEHYKDFNQDFETEFEKLTPHEIMEDFNQLKEFNDLLSNKLKQTIADYENYRNRSEKEKTFMYDRGIMSFAAALLPILDNFALAVKNANPEDGFVKGVIMIQSQLTAMLTEMGLKKIPAIGEPFNTKFHDAVGHIQSEAHFEQEIVEELTPGYTYKDTIIRHSTVIVAN
jgi:molecular chaperone GrpE